MTMIAPDTALAVDLFCDLRYAPCLFCGGCEQLRENESDCVGSLAPTCGGCLWGQGFAVCP